MTQQDLQQSIANLNNQMTQLLQAIQPLLLVPTPPRLLQPLHLNL
jgi:hypothetical protein